MLHYFRFTTRPYGLSTMLLSTLLLARPFLYAFHAHLRFPVDLVWFRLSCDHGWIRSGSVNVRKQQQQQQCIQYVFSMCFCSSLYVLDLFPDPRFLRFVLQDIVGYNMHSVRVQYVLFVIHSTC